MKLTTILTKRQEEVFLLLAQGYTAREIADKLNVSLATVSKVLRKVYSKLDVKNALNATREALLSGLLSLDNLKRGKEEKVIHE